jgi:hypothetical protein
MAFAFNKFHEEEGVDTDIVISAGDLRYLKLDQTSPQVTVGTFTFPTVNFGATTGVSATATNGVLTLKGLKTGGFNEDLTIDFDSTSNQVRFNSTTGALFNFLKDLQVPDNIQFAFGSSTDTMLRFTTTGNDCLQFGLTCNAADNSGYLCVVEKADLGVANRSPLAVSVDPVFRIYSADASNATDYIEFFHNQTIAVIQAGDGAISLASNIKIGTGSPTAALHLKAGTTSAFTAPLKFTSGSLTTAAEAGAVEFLTDDFYGTITTGAARYKFALAKGTSSQFIKGDGSLDSSVYLTSVTAHNLLSATHGDTTAGTVARGDVITGQGASAKWVRLAKGSANQVLSMDATGTDVVWAAGGGGGTPGGSTTQLQYNNAGAFGGMSGFTFNNATGRATFGSWHTSAVAKDYMLVVGQGAFDDLVGSRSHFTCRLDTGCVGIIDSSNTFSYAKSRGVRLDVVAGTSDLLPEFSLTGSASFEQNCSDRNRIFLTNRYPFTSQDPLTSSSSVIHWTEYYDDPDIYVAPVQRSAYEMGNDYYLGQTGGSLPTWVVSNHNFYFWDSSRGYLREINFDQMTIKYMWNSVALTSEQVFFHKHREGGYDQLYWGNQAGNDQGDGTYGSSIYIGGLSGYNKGYGGTNLFLGHGTGGSQTNGSYDTFLGHYTGTVLDGGNNLAVGIYAGSSLATGYTSGSSSILIGSGANHALGNGRLIIDNYGRGTGIATKRDAMIFATANYSNPHQQTISLNADVSVQGLNAICDDDSGEPIFDDDTGEMVFAEAF